MQHQVLFFSNTSLLTYLLISVFPLIITPLFSIEHFIDLVHNPRGYLTITITLERRVDQSLFTKVPRKHELFIDHSGDSAEPFKQP